MAKGLIINSYAIDIINILNDADAAALLRVLVAYYKGNEIPEMTTPVQIAFSRIADDNQKFDPEHRKSISEMRSEIGKKGAEAKWGGDGKQWQTMANDGKTPLAMANTANPHKEKNIDKDKEIDKKTSVFEDRGGAGEEETRKSMSNNELSQFITGAKRKGLSFDAAIRLAVDMGLIDEKQAIYQESPQT